MFAALRGSSRTLLLLAVVLAFVAGVQVLNYASDRALAQANSVHALDRFGNPWNPHWREDNARLARLDRMRPWLVWGGVLPSDLLLMAAAVSDLKQGKRRWFAVLVLVAGLGLVLLLALAAFASLLPGPAMIG